MGRGVPGILGFTSGELTPLMDARVDQDKYALGCKTLQNFICTLQGPVIRRAGTRYVGTTNANKPAWLSRFQFNRQQSYILEWTDNTLRFFTQRALLLLSGSPYTVATPWTYAQLTTLEGTLALQFAQVGDIVYMVHNSGNYPVYKLSRLGATNWTLAPVTFVGGPFQDVVPANTLTVTPSANGPINGSITLTASSALFNANHVGALFYMQLADYSAFPAWETAKAIALNGKYRYNGSVYDAIAAATTGTLPPTQLIGAAKDGVTGVNWEYLHSGYGWVQITAFTSSTVVTATILSQLPGDGTAGTGTSGAGGTALDAPIAFTQWAFGDFNANDGYPVAIEFYQDRLALAKATNLYFSGTGTYEDMSAKTGFEPVASDALWFTVGIKEIDQIRWLSTNRDLLVGTDNFEFSVSPQSTQQAFGPGNIQSTPQTQFGSRTLQPIEWDNATLYVQAAGRRLREAKYSIYIDRYQSEDLTVLSEHIGQKQIVDMALQRENDPVLWMTMADGTLAGMTYNRERGVIAWHRHPLGGFSDVGQSINALCLSNETISAPTDVRDDVWCCVQRYINNATVYFMEYIEDYRLLDTSQNLIFYVDAGLSYSGAPATYITGFNHLIGQTVQIAANGGAHENKVVDNSGGITLDFAASNVSAGLGYTSILQTMRTDFGAADGTSQSRMKSPNEIVLRLQNTIGGKWGAYVSQPVAGPKLNPIPMRPTNLPVGTPVPIFSGDKYGHLPANWDRDGFIYIQQDQPLPMTIVGIYPRMETND